MKRVKRRNPTPLTREERRQLARIEMMKDEEFWRKVTMKTWEPGPDWQDISTAPRNGFKVQLLIPYNRRLFTEKQCTDVGYWEVRLHDSRVPSWAKGGCWRFKGDDGPYDIQPTHWKPLDTK